MSCFSGMPWKVERWTSTIVTQHTRYYTIDTKVYLHEIHFTSNATNIVMDPILTYSMMVLTYMHLWKGINMVMWQSSPTSQWCRYPTACCILSHMPRRQPLFGFVVNDCDSKGRPFPWSCKPSWFYKISLTTPLSAWCKGEK